MNNLEKWRFYLKDMQSPNSYINMGFYYMISCALQRRVYLNATKMPLFANQYIVLVGDAGLGKSMVIRHVTEFLKYHLLYDKRSLGVKTLPPGIPKRELTNKEKAEEMARENPEMFKEVMSLMGVDTSKMSFSKLKDRPDPLLIPVAANCTTYEALTRSLADSIRSIQPEMNGQTHMWVKNGIYSYSTACFSLSEVSSLFKKYHEDVIRFLHETYDCEEDYVYETKNQGIDRIKRVCVNLLGGSTFTFMNDAFSNRLLAEGFASRATFVCEDRPRFYKFAIPEFSEEQMACGVDILIHIKRLTTLFGQVSYTPEAYEYFRFYFEEVYPKILPGLPRALIDWNARMNIHVQKLAMAVHFGDSVEMTITLPSCQKAMNILEDLMTRMCDAVGATGKNPLADVGNRILKTLEKFGPKTKQEIWTDFVSDVRLVELEEVLEYLFATGKIKKIEGERLKSMRETNKLTDDIKDKLKEP